MWGLDIFLGLLFFGILVWPEDLGKQLGRVARAYNKAKQEEKT